MGEDRSRAGPGDSITVQMREGLRVRTQSTPVGQHHEDRSQPWVMEGHRPHTIQAQGCYVIVPYTLALTDS